MNTYKPPDISSINLEAPAAGLAKASPPEKTARKKSKPPKQATSPNNTAMCIHTFRRAGSAIHSTPITRMGTPSMAGIQEVIDVEPELNETIVAQAISQSP